MALPGNAASLTKSLPANRVSPFEAGQNGFCSMTFL